MKNHGGLVSGRVSWLLAAIAVFWGVPAFAPDSGRGLATQQQTEDRLLESWRVGLRRFRSDPVGALRTVLNGLSSRPYNPEFLFDPATIQEIAAHFGEVRNWNAVIDLPMPERLVFATTVLEMSRLDNSTQGSQGWKDLITGADAIFHRVLEKGDPSSPNPKYLVSQAEWLGALEGAIHFASDEQSAGQVLERGSKRFEEVFKGDLLPEFLTSLAPRYFRLRNRRVIFPAVRDAPVEQRALAILGLRSIAGQGDSSEHRQLQLNSIGLANRLNLPGVLPHQLFGTDGKPTKLQVALSALKTDAKRVGQLSDSHEKRRSMANLTLAAEHYFYRLPDDVVPQLEVADAFMAVHSALGAPSETDPLRALASHTYSNAMDHGDLRVRARGMQSRLGGYRQITGSERFVPRLFEKSDLNNEDLATVRRMALTLIPNPSDTEAMSRLFPQSERLYDRKRRAKSWVPQLVAKLWDTAVDPRSSAEVHQGLKRLVAALGAAGLGDSEASNDAKKALERIESAYPYLTRPRSVLGRVLDACRALGRLR